MTASYQEQHQPTSVASATEVRQELMVRDLAGWASKHADAVATLIEVPESSDLFLLSQAAKLTEEVGELHAAILGHLKHQRPGKFFDHAAIEAEIADVIICAVVISHVMKIDATSALRSKMNTLDARMHALIA
ncbi:hypothetical protein A5645_13510 [Mycobacterium asiaticum]|uniref:MazG nucleotide pyrophosphohydrolase domain-containing protein n=1 Tax=Mycobacterium asiaticum TaxID=1790 RepID=UPI0007F01643|nr:MazG nucleotide pyrophosphohydrolase domain-containing protein [Mycobacterium asiaticum]OBK95342.1 hypothetical protein A5645_13510 [Mycobacterium asiaticum]